MHELYQTRAAIEGQMARILAERHTPQYIAALRKTISEKRTYLLTRYVNTSRPTATYSPGDHMAMVDVIETGNKIESLAIFIKHIQDGFDLQMEAIHKVMLLSHGMLTGCLLYTSPSPRDRG